MPSCFIAMPVSTSSEHARLYDDDAHFHHVLVHLMVPAVEKAGYEAIQPIATGADLIHAKIIQHLETADMVLCDISTLNPNVFFELGVRTAVDRPVCIVKDSLTDRIPFDTSVLNVHTYAPSLAPWLLEGEVNALDRHLQASALGSDDRNTLWRYFGLTTRAAFKEGESSLEEKVDLLLLQIQGLESQARSRSAQDVFRASAASESDVVHYPQVRGLGSQTRSMSPEDLEEYVRYLQTHDEKDAPSAASGFLAEVQQITRARIREIKFAAGSVILTYDGPVSPDERVALGHLGARYHIRLYVDNELGQAEVPGE